MNKDIFGCTSFRVGDFLGRSLDYYKNYSASTVLHTTPIEGERYESIGISGCADWMNKSELKSGTITKSQMDSVFSTIVDGINENGVSVAVLVVPRGDKGITTGTNPSGINLPAQVVARYILDKAVTTDNAISLLSKFNIYQPWDKYELHWMIADSEKTFVIETIDNKLSYLGPNSVVDEDGSVVPGYNGELEVNVATNFYLTDFDGTLEDVNTFTMPITNPTVTPHGSGLERYKIVSDEINSWTPYNLEDAMIIVTKVRYEQVYRASNEWYTEFVGDYPNTSSLLDGDKPSEYSMYVSRIRDEYDRIKGDESDSNIIDGDPIFVTSYDGVDMYLYKTIFTSYPENTNVSSGYSSIYDSNESQIGSAYLGEESGLEGDIQPFIPEFVQDMTRVYLLGPESVLSGYWESKSGSGYISISSNSGSTGENNLRKDGRFWFSNHQCVYDLVNKELLVYASENSKYTLWKFNIDGTYESIYS